MVGGVRGVCSVSARARVERGAWSAPINTAPINTAPCNTSPWNTAPCNTSPWNTAPCNAAPSNAARSTLAPINSRADQFPARFIAGGRVRAVRFPLLVPRCGSGRPVGSFLASAGGGPPGVRAPLRGRRALGAVASARAGGASLCPSPPAFGAPGVVSCLLPGWSRWGGVGPLGPRLARRARRAFPPPPQKAEESPKINLTPGRIRLTARAGPAGDHIDDTKPGAPIKLTTLSRSGPLSNRFDARQIPCQINLTTTLWPN